MTHEVESKFQVTSSEVFHQIRSQKQVAGYRLANQGKFLQRDTYVDTSTRLLLRQGAYLRLRERDGTFLATFKNKIDGNYVRRELEISLTASQAQDLLNGNLANIPGEAIQAAVSHLQGEETLPVLYIENTRELWYLNSEAGCIKICFDDVRYTDGDPNQSASEYELELELEEGEDTFLQEISQALSQRYQLIPNSHSKYERGNMLLNEGATVG